MNIDDCSALFSDKEVVICDFDGTVTELDVCDQIMDIFGPTDWRSIGWRYDQGHISHREMNDIFVSHLKCSPVELAGLLRSKIRIRDGFVEFLEYCRSKNIYLIIVSGGWDYYMKIILEDFHIRFIYSFESLADLEQDELPIICNQLIFDQAKKEWKLLPSHFTSSLTCSPDKRSIAGAMRFIGANAITLVGDGASDYDLASEADYVLSRESLSSYCLKEGIPHSIFSTFFDVVASLRTRREGAIRVLSLPSYHPYNRRFDNYGEINFVNPGSDFFGDGKVSSPHELHDTFPPDSYDIVHIHFEYYLFSVELLEGILQYFEQSRRPVVWTCHDRSSLIEEKTNYEHEGLLYKYASKVMTLTNGCRTWLLNKFGEHRDNIDVIPLGYLAHPAVVDYESKSVVKDRNLFTIYVGDFRKSKSYLSSIREFLGCNRLQEARLQVIYRSPEIGFGDKENIENFLLLVTHPRVSTISLPEISDTLFVRKFLASHAVILPYKWGTHSGQLELARDCGCHVVASKVGYYSEQWPDVIEYLSGDDYRDALVEAYEREPLEPAGHWRKTEFDEIYDRHVRLYRRLIAPGHV